MDERPNFYTILELDPAITDWPSIESCILEKKRIWSHQKLMGTPGQKRKAERNLSFLDDMNSLFKDTDSRKQELKNFKSDRDKKKNSQLKELDDLIKMHSKKTATPQLIKTLISQTKKVFSDKEIEARLIKNGILLETGAGKKSTATSTHKLDSSTSKEIFDELNTLKLGSLYDFLNLDHKPKLSNRSSPKNLYERASLIYKEQSKSGNTDPITTLKIQLVGRCKSCFENTKNKERYDNSYESQALLSLDKFLEIAGIEKFIEAAEISKLICQGKKLGVAQTQVLEYIESFAQKRKWGIQQESRSELLQPLCGYCGELSISASDSRCKACGEAFIQPCPKCGKNTATEDSACGHCGCHIGDAPLVKSLYREGNSFFDEGDFDQANSLFKRALSYWDDWKPAVDALAVNQQKKKQCDKLFTDIKSLIIEKRIEFASKQLTTFSQQFPKANVADIKVDIDQSLKKAENFFNQAEKLRVNGDSELAFDKYQQSLLICTDYSSAQKAIASNPPIPPTNIEVTWHGSTLRLNWPKVNAQGLLKYRVLRKSDGAPSNSNDGEIIAETANTHIDDTELCSGSCFYYGVFTLRSGAISSTFATSGPHRFLSPPEQLKSLAGDGQVSISWKKPKGCMKVEVWRRAGLAPSQRGEGQQLSASELSVVDTGLDNDRNYGYLLLAKYSDPNNSKTSVYSTGVSVKARPVATPVPILDLEIKRCDSTVFLSWTPPSGDKEQVQIRQARSISNVTSGKYIALDEADDYGILLGDTSQGSAQSILTTQGRVFYIPLTVSAQTAVLGSPVSVTSLDDLTELTSRQNGNSIILTWEWPKGATEAIVVYDHQYYPQSAEQSGVAKSIITKEEYLIDNFWELRSTGRKKHYFTVFISDPSTDVYSAGVNILESMGQETTVLYEVKVQKHWLTRKVTSAWLVLQSEDDLQLEDLQVVIKQKLPPVSKDDGILITQLRETVIRDGTGIIKIPENNLSNQGFIKLFFSNSTMAQEIRLMPKRQELLRLN